MGPRNNTMGRSAAPGLALLACINAAAPTWADGATRDLPETYAPGILLSVSIQLDALLQSHAVISGVVLFFPGEGGPESNRLVVTSGCE